MRTISYIIVAVLAFALGCLMEDSSVYGALIISTLTGFSLGMYVTTQISDWIERKR